MLYDFLLVSTVWTRLDRDLPPLVSRSHRLRHQDPYRKRVSSDGIRTTLDRGYVDDRDHRRGLLRSRLHPPRWLPVILRRYVDCREDRKDGSGCVG
jgi:hypothetical protein